MVRKHIMQIFFGLCIIVLVGCGGDKPKPQATPPQAKDLKRLELYNQLDNLKEGIWHVDEWKALAAKICNASQQKDCSVMAEIYYETFYGYGSRGDRQKGIKMLQEGCNLGDSKSCLKLATLASQSDYPVGSSTDLFSKARDLAKKRCDANYAMDCYVLALLEFEGYGGVPRNRIEAKQLAHKACDMNHAGSCIFLTLNADTREEMLQASKKACNIGVKQFCK